MPIALRWLLSASERDQTIWIEKLNYHIFNCICWIRYINCIFYSTSQSKIRSEMDSSHWQKAKYQQRKEWPSTGFYATKKMMSKKELFFLSVLVETCQQEAAFTFESRRKYQNQTKYFLSCPLTCYSLSTLIQKPSSALDWSGAGAELNHLSQL